MRRLGLAILVWGLPVALYAADTTTVGTLTLTSTIQSVSIVAAYTNDDNGTNSCTIRYKRTADVTWITGYPPWVDRRATVPSGSGDLSNTANQFQCRGSVVGLQANTSYDIELTWVDADGITGSNPVTGSVSTKPSTPTTGGTTYYVDSSDGSDSDDGLSSANAWQTMAKVIATIAAGDTVNCNGTFAAFSWTKSGAAGSFVKLQTESGGSCTISAAANVLTVSANYVWIHNLTIGASTTGCGILLSGALNNIYLTSNTIANWGSTTAVGGFCFSNNAINNVFILNNSITRTSSDSSTDHAHIRFNGSGPYHTMTIDANTLSGPAWDAIGNGSNSVIDNLTNMDWSNNTIANFNDDAMEMDGGCRNLRVWGNIVSTTVLAGSVSGNGATAISEAGCMVGPGYIFRNYLTTAGGVGVKGGHYANGPAYYFHNTIKATRTGGGGYQALTQSGGATSSELSVNHVFLNNIFYTVQDNIHEDEGARTGNNYDYNVAFCTVSCTAVSDWNTTTDYSSWSDFITATGFEDFGGTDANGVFADPLFDGSDHIDSSSPAYNIGLAIANFNSSDSCWPSNSTPDVGAYEVSATWAVTCVPSDATPPTVSITAPTSNPTHDAGSTSPLTTLAGSAADTDSGIASVTWVSDCSGSGTATGTTSWSVSSITLCTPTTVITVTAHNGAGGTAQDTLTVSYVPAGSPSAPGRPVIRFPPRIPGDDDGAHP